MPYFIIAVLFVSYMIGKEEGRKEVSRGLNKCNEVIMTWKKPSIVNSKSGSERNHTL